MNQISSAATGAATVGATTLYPIVVWALHGFTGPVPETLPGLIVSAILTAAHWASNYFTSKNGATPTNTGEPS